MPSINHKRKSKTSKKSSKSSKRSKNVKRSKKTRSNIRKMRGGGIVEYSENLINWLPARDYQSSELNQAIEKNYFIENPNASYNSSLKNFKFKIIPYDKDKYIMLRNDDTFAYLQVKAQRTQIYGINTLDTFLRKQATADMNVDYLGQVITIKKDKYYWVEKTQPLKPIIGWHGTTNPPLGMDGESMLI